MSRPRAGRAWTWLRIGERSVDLMLTSACHWITTGEARGWPRCSRCRRPVEELIDPLAVCGACFNGFLPGQLRCDLRKQQNPLVYIADDFSRFMAAIDELGEIQRAIAAGMGWRRALRSFNRPAIRDEVHAQGA